MWCGKESKKKQQASHVPSNAKSRSTATTVCVLLATRCEAAAHDAIATQAISTQQHSQHNNNSGSGTPAFLHAGIARQQHRRRAPPGNYVRAPGNCVRASLQAGGIFRGESLSLAATNKTPSAANKKAHSVHAVSAAVLSTESSLPGSGNSSSSPSSATMGGLLPPDWQRGATSERGARKSTEESRTSSGVNMSRATTLVGVATRGQVHQHGTSSIHSSLARSSIISSQQREVSPVLEPPPPAAAVRAVPLRDAARKPASFPSGSHPCGGLVSQRRRVEVANNTASVRVATSKTKARPPSLSAKMRRPEGSSSRNGDHNNGSSIGSRVGGGVTVQPVKLARHLADILAKNDWRRVLAVFNEARRLDALLDTTGTGEEGEGCVIPARLSRGAYNQALLAYVMGRNGRGALALLKEMRQVGGRLAPTRSSYNACLEACKVGRQRKEVMSVLDMMVEDGIPPSGRSHSFALQACAKEGNVADARKILEGMWTSPDLEGGVPGLRPTTWGYNCAVEACAKAGDWGAAVELMSEMEERGLAHDAFTYGGALEACGRLGQWEQAQAILKRMGDAYTRSVAEGTHGGASIAPTTVHCNALLSAYCRGYRLPEALDLLDSMLAAPPLGAEFSSVPQRSDPSRLDVASAADAIVMVTPTEANGSAAATTENKSCSPGAGGPSSKIRNPTAADDACTTPTEFSGDSLHGGGPPSIDNKEEVKRVQKRRRGRGMGSLWDDRLPLPRADAVSFGTVIDGCSRARDADSAVMLLTRMRQAGAGDDSRRYSSSSTSRPAVGLNAGVALPVGGGGGGGGGVPLRRQGGGGSIRGGRGDGGDDSSSTTVGVRGVVVVSPPQLPSQLPQVLPPNAHCVTAAITACGRAGRPEQAVALLHEAVTAYKAWRNRGRRDGDGLGSEEESKLRDRRVGREVAVALEPAYNAAIDACVRAGLHDEARALVGVMREKGVPPGRVAFNSLLLACSDSAEALSILREMERARVAPDASSFTVAIGACSRGDDLPAALELLERMRSGGGNSGNGARGPKVDIVAYGAAAAACARGLDDERAVQLLADARRDGLRPGQQMYGAVIHACARRGRWKRSLELIGEMASSGVTPERKHYSSAIFACAVGNNPGQGLELLSVMRKKGVTPNSTCVNATMHGFSLLSEWEQALRLLRAMEVNHGVAPDVVSYNTAMAACFRAGEHDRGLALFDEMRLSPSSESGLSPTKASPNADAGVVASTRTPMPDRVTPNDTTTATMMISGAGTRGGAQVNPTGVDAVVVAAAARPPQPDAASYNTVITAVVARRGASGSEGLEEATALVEEMRARGLTPDAFTANSIRSAGGKMS